MKHFIIAAEIYLAGGCFWGTEHFLKQIRGVESTEVGYANSIINQPTYQQVCSGETNAAETVKVVYDPASTGKEMIAVRNIERGFIILIKRISLLLIRLSGH